MWLCVARFGVAWCGSCGLARLGSAWRSVSVSKSCKIDFFYEHLGQFQYSILLDIGGWAELSLPSQELSLPSFSGLALLSRVCFLWGSPFPLSVGLPARGLALPSRICFFFLASPSQGFWPFLEFCDDFGGGQLGITREPLTQNVALSRGAGEGGGRGGKVDLFVHTWV